MSNDIRKNIMLIESIILDESFKDAQLKFSTTASSEEVKQYIDKFKELSKRNIIKGQDKDIGTWIKGDWVDFKQFVDSNSAVVTNRQTKAIQKKDSIVVYKDEDKQVVVPLTKEASIQFGKNTAWCTAYTEARNRFIDYFYIDKITLFYVLFKDGNKYACAYHPEQSDKMECFDQEDGSMDFYEFEEATGISKKEVQEWYNSNKTKIEDSRDLNKCSEEVQLAAVKDDGYAIEFITNPSEEVQLAAVNQNGYVIGDITNPSEAVQLAATNGDGDAIQFIDNPSEVVQLTAVTKFGYAIHWIDNPSEKVQLAAVNQSGGVIGYIVNKGIVPSEEVQLAAVNRNGDAIKYIISKGIVPSEEVQIAAVTNSRYAFEYIDNPSEEVKALDKKRWRQ